MNNKLLVSTAIGFLLVGGIARGQSQSAADQNSDDTWDGPGYYAEDLATLQSDGTQYLFKDGGPFSSYDECEAYFQQNPPTNIKGYTDSFQCTYRGSDPKYSACFLTTACVQHAGLPDDCEELTVMRAFRDGYLSRFEEGRLLIEQYYRIAPRIVERIRRAPDRRRTLGWILREVRASARAVGRGESEAAIVRYAAMVLRLQQRYGVTDNGTLLRARASSRA
jgi:hypothetical protein